MCRRRLINLQHTGAQAVGKTKRSLPVKYATTIALAAELATIAAVLAFMISGLPATTGASIA